MLRDRYRQLLTGYVDGELSSRQHRHVVRLLHHSAEARQLLQQLKADSRALCQLPRPSLPVDLSSSVLRLIAERSLTAGQHRIVKTATATVWIGALASWAAAAAVLLTLGVASYFYFAASLDQPATTEMAQIQAEPSDRSPPSALRHPPTKTAENEPRTAESEPRTVDRKPQKTNSRKQKADGGKRIEESRKQIPDKPPPPPPKEETALTDRLEMFQLDRVPDLLPLVVKVRDLDRASARRKLLDELRKDSAFRMELPCPNGTKAFDSVQNAARTLRISLLIDKQAQERIKLKWKSNYLLYIENMTPEELTQFVKQIGLEDRKPSVRKKNAEAQIDCLVLTRMTAGHRKELSTLLGVDLTTTDSSTMGSPLAGQGEAPRPESAKTDAKTPKHIALVLAYNPARPSAGSEEIKHFLEGRKPLRADAIRVLLVLRGD